MKRNTLTRQLLICVLLVLALFMSGCGSSSSDTIKIGIIMPITGANASTTRDHINGMMIAIDDINNSGGLLGGKKIEVIQEDDRSTPSDGVSAVRKLITQDKVVAILGNFNSSVCAATRDVTNEYKIPQIVAGCSKDDLVTGYPFLFRANSNNTLQTEPFIRWFVKDQGKKRVAILFENTDWGRNLNDVVAKVVKENGGDVPIQESFNPGDTDFLPTLTKIKDVDPDLIISPALVTEAAIIARQAKELDIDRSLFAGWGGWAQTDIHKLSDGAEEGSMFVDFFPVTDPQTPVEEYLVEQIQKRYPDTPPQYLSWTGLRCCSHLD